LVGYEPLPVKLLWFWHRSRFVIAQNARNLFKDQLDVRVVAISGAQPRQRTAYAARQIISLRLQ